MSETMVERVLDAQMQASTLIRLEIAAGRVMLEQGRLAVVRAGIAAMREPTEVMSLAGIEGSPWWITAYRDMTRDERVAIASTKRCHQREAITLSNEDCAKIWSAMIDAALKEGGTDGV